MDMDKIKRERSANFTMLERDILISLVLKYQNVIESKKNDATTWKEKEAAWDSIETEFNAQSGAVMRSSKTLKIKYEGLKRTVRKKSAEIQSEIYLSGGLRNTASSPLDNVEEHLKSMIGLSADGSESLYDSDIKLEPPTQTIPDDKAMEKIMMSNETYCTSCNKSTPKVWDNTSRNNLKSRKHSALIASLPKKNSFDELTKAKLELVHLQKKLVEAEFIEKDKEWKFKEMERQWKEEEYKLKLEKLRKEINGL